jgi:hypothetical protein
MSPRHFRLSIAASAIPLTLLALIVAGTSPGPSGLLLAVITLVPPVIVPLWTEASAIATPATEHRS